MAKYDAAMTPASGSVEKGKVTNWTVSRVEIEPAENGGYTVKCFKKPAKSERDRSTYPGYYEPDTYVYESFDSLTAGLKKTLG